jgi:hypothetical protein
MTEIEWDISPSGYAVDINILGKKHRYNIEEHRSSVRR